MGQSDESLNVFHRWIARLILILSIVHVAGRVYVNVPNSDPRGEGQAFVRWGIVGFALFVFMILGAARPIRNRWYQSVTPSDLSQEYGLTLDTRRGFIILHVSAFILGLVALSVHRPEIAPWLYVGFFIYFLDRAIRTGRIILHHTLRRIKPDDVDGEIGTVEALSASMLRVTVQTTLSWIPGELHLSMLGITTDQLRGKTGQHVYLHVPFLSAGGHPFSVCSIDTPLSNPSASKPLYSKVVLLVRVRQGLTRRLYDLAVEDHEKRVGGFPTAALSPCWAEGPYGNLSHLDYYQTVMLIAGGSGASFTTSVMLDIVRRARGMAFGHRDVSVATVRLTFVWIIKSQGAHLWTVCNLFH